MKQPAEQISLFECMLLIILFEIGTSIVVGIGTDADRNAWIAVIIANIIGLGLFYMYFQSFKMQRVNLYELIIYCFGKFIGKMIVFLYIIYFLYITVRVLRDFNELLITIVLPVTPIEFSSLIFMAVVSYVIYLGFEVFSRTTVVFAPYILLFLAAIVFFLSINSSIDLSNLQPVLSSGIKPIWEAVFPGLITFPFGELIVFTVILPQVKNTQKGFRPFLLAIIAAGVLINIYTILNISVLGSSAYSRTVFPLLSSAREISIANFLERLDALVVFIVMLGVFVKVSIFFYCALKGFEFVYRLSYRYFAFPVGMMIAIFSTLIAFSLNEHLKEGLVIVPYYLHLPFQFVIPFLIFLVVAYKKKKGGGFSNEKKSKEF